MSTVNLVTSFETAYQDDNVREFVKKWGIWKDSKSNLFSKSTQDFVRNSSVIPDVVKEKYFSGVSTADRLTGGLASSNVLTKGLRYSKLINKGIDFGLEVSEYAAGKMNDLEDKINQAIDNNLEAMREERALKDAERKSKDRELPVIKEPEPEPDYYPGMGKRGRLL